MSSAEGVVRIDSKEGADDGRAFKVGLLVHNIGAEHWDARAYKVDEAKEQSISPLSCRIERGYLGCDEAAYLSNFSMVLVASGWLLRAPLEQRRANAS